MVAFTGLAVMAVGVGVLFNPHRTRAIGMARLWEQKAKFRRSVEKSRSKVLSGRPM